VNVKLKQLVKAILGGGVRRPHRIWTGAFKGLVLNLDALNATQKIVGLYERETYASMRVLTAGIKTGIDIGLAEGEFAIYLLKLTGAKKVLAFEPNPENETVFLDNLRSNAIDAGDHLQVFKTYLGRRNEKGCSTLDSYVAELVEPIFVKMDVDGGEVDILLGSQNLLRMSRVRFLIETHSLELEERCTELLREHGFETKVIYNAWWRRFVKDQRPIEHNRWLIGYKSSDMKINWRCR